MSYHVLDSDAVIDVLKGIPASRALIESLVANGQTLATSDVVVGEVYSGLRPEDRATGEQLMNSLTFLPTSRDAARQAGAWRYAFARRGAPIAMTDALIAATALAHGAVVVTGNVRDYPMSGLTVLPLPRTRRT